MIARETFKYVHNGSVPLLTDGRKILLLQVSGSIYTKNDRYSQLEFPRMYLQEMFTNIMGFDSFQIVRAQGTSTSYWNDQSMPKVYSDLKKQMVEFYQD
ncbi:MULTISPECIES: hypothetical protein [Lactobacillus]|uniref:hypothetical protein n=1 Tax=Lactobacillus TaxID=1578 RepID=UPI002621DB1C|nr:MULTISPECIES: hypothetical protein [Lactobacillus]